MITIVNLVISIRRKALEMRTFIVFTVFVLLIGMAVGQQTENTLAWERIGQDKAGNKVKNKSMSVDKDKQYKYIKLQVNGAAVIIEKWVLEYRNTTVQHVGFVGLASAEGDFPAIPVNGRLKKVHLRYYSAEKNKKATIEILGTG